MPPFLHSDKFFLSKRRVNPVFIFILAFEDIVSRFEKAQLTLNFFKNLTNRQSKTELGFLPRANITLIHSVINIDLLVYFQRQISKWRPLQQNLQISC